MSKSSSEQTADFLLGLLPSLLPKPVDSVAKSAIDTFRGPLDSLLSQPRLKKELLEAAQKAESDFRAKAKEQLKSDDLTQAVASFPLFDRELFQSTLQSLPEHLNEDFLASHLQTYIADDWKGEFSPVDLREGVAIYLNCLRIRLLKVDGFGELIARLATLRIDQRTTAMQMGIEELLRRSEKQLQEDIKIQVVIEGSLHGFTASKREELVGVLAVLLKIEEQQVRILSVTSGSILINFLLPSDAANELYSLYQNKDPRLVEIGITKVILLADGSRQNLVTSLFTIPLPVTDFTGREKELAQLKASFKNGAVITGMSGGGGVGKTELARKLAQEIADDYPNARMSIDLRGTSENPLAPEEVMRRILEPFYPNQKLPDEPEQLKGLYQQTFSVQKAILLLDNAASAMQVRPLIPPAPSAAIITSRQHFSLTEFGLSEPLRLDVLSFEEARELLRTASPKLKESRDEEVDALAQICGRLPLALRVAASILNDRADWTLASLLKRLGDELTRLQRLKREGDGDLDVEAVLGLSYDLLDKELKKNFRILGLFTAPFINISAQAIWQIEDMQEVDQYIGRLTSLSLLNILPSPFGTGQDDETIYLYALHDLTRLFAMNQLLKDEEEARQSIILHANHFLEWASEADDLYKKGNENVLFGLAQFRFIWSHLEVAYERLLPEQRFLPRPPQADEWLGGFPGRCPNVLDLHLSPSRKIPILETALSASLRLEEKQSEGVHLGNLGNAYAALGDARKAIEFYEQALVIDREIGDRRGEGADLGNMGLAYAALGDAHKAIEIYEQALVIDREIGDRRGEGAVLGNLGNAYADFGGARKAIEIYEQALVIDREIGDRRGEGNALSNLGNAYAALGDARKAIEFYEQALVIDREIGDRRGEGAVLGNLGNAYAALGDARKAIEFYEQALVIDREIGDRRGEGNALGNLGNAYAALGDARKAIEIYEAQLVITREIGDRRGEGNALSNLGNAYAALGDARKAIEFYEAQLVITREIGDRRGEGAALGNLGIAYKNSGDARKAIEFYEQALIIDREIGDRRGEGNALGNMGLAYAALGDARKAIEFYEAQLVITREIGDRRGEGAALSNLGLAYKNLGEKEKSKKSWLEALAIFRAIESPHVATVEKWLADLDGVQVEEKSEISIQDFIRTVFQAVRSKDLQAQRLFDIVSNMKSDTNLSIEEQELAKVLWHFMAGIKKPDLSRLPEEFAKVVKEELEK